MQATTSTPMLWTEMTDDLAEAVNGGYYYQQYYYYYEKPKKEKCGSYSQEPSYCSEDKKYDNCNKKSKSWW